MDIITTTTGITTGVTISSDLTATGLGARPRTGSAQRLIADRPLVSFEVEPFGVEPTCLLQARTAVRSELSAVWTRNTQVHNGFWSNEQHVDVMGGYVADDFDTRWGSRPGSPPE